MTRPTLHSVPSPTADEQPRPPGETYSEMHERTCRLVRRMGASLFTTRIEDQDGNEVSERDLDLGRAEHVRVCAVAKFPKGPEVVGRSEPIGRDHYVLYLLTFQWMEAFTDLRNQFGPTVAAIPPTGRSS